MCLGTVSHREEIRIGYKFFYGEPDGYVTTPYRYQKFELNKWHLPSNLGETLEIPSFVKVKGKTLDDHFSSKDYRKLTGNPISKYQDYLSGFHLLTSLEDAEQYKATASCGASDLYKCEYLGVLASGYDYTSVQSLKHRVKCVVALAMRVIEPIRIIESVKLS